MRRISWNSLRAFWMSGAFAVLCLSSARAQPNLRSLFPQQAPVYTATPSLSRLDLPVEVLSACRADLSDLRIFDAQGNEVAYLLDSGRPEGSELSVVRRFAAQTVNVSRRETDGSQSPPAFHEEYELVFPQEAADGQAWDLVLQTNVPHFVSRVSVTVDEETGSPRTLIEEGSFFRISNPTREKLRIALPAFKARRMTVVLDGEDGSYLEPVFALETSRSLPPGEQAKVELREASRREEPGRTIIELERPRGLRADFLVIAAGLSAFSRVVEVWDEGPAAGDQALGRQLIYRVEAMTSVEDLTVPLAAAGGDKLRIVIHNGDSPPLQSLTFTAVAPRPALLFTLPPQGENTPAGMLRFGGGRAYRPAYDLQRLSPLLNVRGAGETARATEQLHATTPARLGEIAYNPEYNGGPVLSFAMRPGGVIDSRLYTHRRTVQLFPSEEGLARLALTVEDLAAASENLDDLRIVNSNSRQWAYLLERGSGHETRALTIKGPDTDNGVSEYELTLPAHPATFDQVEIDSQAEYFSREFELVAQRDKQEIALARGRMSRRVGDPRPVVISVDARRVDGLKLRITDGNDAPLELTRVEASFPVPEVYLAAPAGEYTLLFGNADDHAPSYEIAEARAMVLAVRSGEATLGPLEANPRYSATAKLGSGSGPQQVVLWIALLAAVAILSLVTLKMVRKQPPDAPVDAKPADATAAAAQTTPPPDDLSAT